MSLDEDTNSLNKGLNSVEEYLQTLDEEDRQFRSALIPILTKQQDKIKAKIDDFKIPEIKVSGKKYLIQLSESPEKCLICAKDYGHDQGLIIQEEYGINKFYHVCRTHIGCTSPKAKKTVSGYSIKSIFSTVKKFIKK